MVRTLWAQASVSVLLKQSLGININGQPVAMPLAELTAEQKTQGLAAMSPGLRFLLEEKNVGEDIIAVIGHQEVTELNIFARIEATEVGFRDWVKTDLEIEPTGRGRVQTATLVDAWEKA